MKPSLPFSLIFFSKRFYRAFVLLLPILVSFQIRSSAQCASGYTSATLNWDYRDYLHRNGSIYGGTNPVTTLPFVTVGMTSPQYFAFGTNKVTLTSNVPVTNSSSLSGDATTHAGDVPNYTGADIAYTPSANGQAITLSFQSEVQNLSFTVYDVDRSQVLTFSGTNASAVAQTVTVATYATSGTSILTVGGTATARTITATNTAIASPDNRGTATVSIAGPVKNVVITVTTVGTDQPFWLSDVIACTPDPGFPTSYYATYTTPYTNQPSYFLSNPQNLHMYIVNASTAEAHLLFSEPGGTPAGTNKMNSIAYDPVNHWIYYTMDNATNYPGNLVLKKYDVTTGTISTVIANLNTFGIPSFIQAVEYAGAAFYNGSLYLGVEGSDGVSYSTNAESIIWKIDFDGSGNATGFSQAFSYPGDNGSNPTHDWGDFVIKDGVVITHATGTTSASNHYIHYNMQTGAGTYYVGSGIVAGQLGQTSNGNVYRINNSIALYNNNGTVGATTAVTTTSCSPAWSSNAGDASDPFRPMQDFGDAPSSYDPVALSVAANQRACNNSTLRIGSAWGDEWSKNTTADASGDDEEDGITTVTTMVSDGVAYNHVQDVEVLNNTGANAYLAGWLDYDADGVCEAGEGVIMTVPSNASPQTISLAWNGITVATGTPNTFLRVRLSSTALTTNDATGWFSDGETEDYPVISQALPLTIQLLDFNASVTRDKSVLLSWKAYADEEALGFEIQRSNDQNTWENIGWIDINKSAFTAEYNFTDQQPLQGKSYYRLQMVEKTGSSRYSAIRIIQLDHLISKVKIYPNPVKKDVTVSFNSATDQTARLIIRSTAGVTVINKTISLTQGENSVQLSTLSLSNGLYIVELSTSEKTFINRLTVSH